MNRIKEVLEAKGIKQTWLAEKLSDGFCKSNYVKTKGLPAIAKILVKKGDILISKVRPYSGAVTVLREKETSIFSNEVLKVLLRTKEYKE